MDSGSNIFQGSSIPRLVAKFAVPTVLSQLITLLYNLADTFFVGHTNDPAQIAALTLSFPLFMSLTMVGNLFGIGGSSFISRSLGQGDRKQAQKASTFAFWGALMAVLALIALLGIFMRPVLTVIGAITEETFLHTRSYITWTVLIGGVPTVAALMLGHLIRAEGNTRQASIGMSLGGVLNIGLDYVFVSLLGQGIRGAAIATCLSNVVSFLYLLFILLRTKDSVIVLHPARLRFESHIVRQVILVGIPAAVLIVLGAAANVVLTHFMAVYGEISIAAFGIVQKMGSICVQITIGLSHGIMPLLGFCCGARDIKRMKAVSTFSFFLLGGFALVCFVVVQAFARPLLSLFTTEAATVEKGVGFLRLWFFCAPGMCFTNLLCSIFQALGKWLHSLILSIIRQGILLMPLLTLFNRLWGEIGLVCGQPIADTLALGAGLVIYAVLMKQFKAELGSTPLE